MRGAVQKNDGNFKLAESQNRARNESRSNYDGLISFLHWTPRISLRIRTLTSRAAPSEIRVTVVSITPHCKQACYESTNQSMDRSNFVVIVLLCVRGVYCTSGPIGSLSQSIRFPWFVVVSAGKFYVPMRFSENHDSRKITAELIALARALSARCSIVI